jgi:hypothetical protein
VTVSAIEFPIIEFSQGQVLGETSQEGLTTCSSRGLKSGWFKKLYLIDSACRGYPVEKVEKVGYANPFFGLSLMYGRRYRIDLQLGPAEQHDLGEVKRRVVKAMERNRSFWESGYSLEELKQKVGAAESVADIVALLV